MDAQVRKLWEEVLKTPNLRLVGGEIEFLEGGEEFLGPIIVEARLTESGLFVKMDQVARLELDEGRHLSHGNSTARGQKWNNSVHSAAWMWLDPSCWRSSHTTGRDH